MRHPLLFAFPEAPDTSSGYGKVVGKDLAFIKSFFHHRVDLYYSNRNVPRSSVVPRRSKRDPGRLLKFIVSAYPSGCLDARDLPANVVTEASPHAVFCGDSCLYPGLRSRFPQADMVVRFHNVYATAFLRIIQERMWWAAPLVVWEMFRYVRLEMEIFRDQKVIPVFLCKEEAAFFRSLHPGRRSYIKAVFPRGYGNVHLNAVRRLIWLGGLSGHKLISMKRFLQRDWPRILAHNTGLGLDLYGAGTDRFRGIPGVTAHGVWQGSGWPGDGDSLFINPDYIGGGVKIKMLDYLESGVPFISTPVGAQGLRIPNARGWVVAPIDEWPELIGKLR